MCKVKGSDRIPLSSPSPGPDGQDYVPVKSRPTGPREGKDNVGGGPALQPYVWPVMYTRAPATRKATLNSNENTDDSTWNIENGTALGPTASEDFETSTTKKTGHLLGRLSGLGLRLRPVCRGTADA